MWFGNSFFIHILEHIEIYGIGKCVVDLLELILIPSFKNSELCRIQSDDSRDSSPGLSEQSDGYGYVSVFYDDVYQQISSCVRIQVGTLCIVHDE